MRRPGRGIRVGFLLALAGAPALHGSCGRGRFDSARPDIVLVVVDTLRADHLGAYGYSRPTSPAIDAFASRATVFDDAWAAAPWTLPSVMSIMTGRLPSRHRVENDGLTLAPEIPTLAETLEASGYDTGAFVSHVYVDRPFGFARGFETFEDFGLSWKSVQKIEYGLTDPQSSTLLKLCKAFRISLPELVTFAKKR